MLGVTLRIGLGAKHTAQSVLDAFAACSAIKSQLFTSAEITVRTWNKSSVDVFSSKIIALDI